MLIWWIISLSILIICIVFAYRMIVSTYEFLPANKRYFLRFNKNISSTETGAYKANALKSLDKKVQSVENNTAYYEIQFSKLQERIHALEELNKIKPSLEKDTTAKEKVEEDWEELYYQENNKKEKLENDLDFITQKLEETENKLNEFSQNSAQWVELRSEYEASLNNLHSLQNHIGLLNRKLEASTEREKELEQLLLSEITLREKYSLLHNQYVELQSETDDLRRRIVELSKKDVALQTKILHINELESKLAFCENEKIKLKSRLEELLQQTSYYNNS